ncbi:UNVERIFIED_CONTAM: NAC domain-containing protein 48 [Sesamum angustifolium]|uniref:NAC domain-containing protein 48 n=1 Tax=Sesamum angustifolium TaxID=2727405 RepID=A0AAW2L9D7_9LAMI
MDKHISMVQCDIIAVNLTAVVRSVQLDDWVLCRIYNKKGTIERQQENVSSRNMASAVTSEEDIKPVVLTSLPEAPPLAYEDFVYLDPTDSIPRLHTDSSCSEHVLSPEVESAPKLAEWEKSAIEFPFSYMDAGNGGCTLMSSQFQGNYQMDPMNDVFAYITKPF